MRHGALLAGIVWVLSGCQAGTSRTGRLDPVALCDSVQVDSGWQRVAIGDSLTVLVPPSAQHPRPGDSFVPWTQIWMDGYLTVEWQTISTRSTDRDPFDSVPGPSVYSVPASPDCSAPAPEGWFTHTFIWKDGESLMSRTFIVPPAPRRWVLDLTVWAYRPAAYGRAIAVIKSLRPLRALPSN